MLKAAGRGDLAAQRPRQDKPGAAPYCGDQSPRAVPSGRRRKVLMWRDEPTTRQQQLAMRRAPSPGGRGGRRGFGTCSLNELAPCAAKKSSRKRDSVICNIRLKISSVRWHFLYDPPAPTRTWKYEWPSTTALADGARLAHRWIKQAAPWADGPVDGDQVAKGWKGV